MVRKLSPATRVLTAIAALGLIVAIYFPIWKIDLTAPQYPEGLHLTISADELGGDLEIVNGLNHYIGMKTLHADDFTEFKILPWLFWGLVGFGLFTAIINRRKVFNLYFTVFILFAVIAMLDFYRWEYDYGHNLDPNAPIQVPGMSYQPPLIGYKQLLNFTAYSIPDKGGWAFIGGGVFLLVGFTIEIIRQRKQNRSMNRVINVVPPAAAAMLTIVLTSCATGPEPIQFGKDACDYCKMTIIDKKFGGEIVTDKGKIFRFDDIRCIVDFINAGSADKATSTIYFLDYGGKGNLLRSDSAFLMKSEELRSPMGGTTAAFSDEASRQSSMQQLNGTSVNWVDVLK